MAPGSPKTFKSWPNRSPPRRGHSRSPLVTAHLLSASLSKLFNCQLPIALFSFVEHVLYHETLVFTKIYIGFMYPKKLSSFNIQHSTKNFMERNRRPYVTEFENIWSVFKYSICFSDSSSSTCKMIRNIKIVS